MTTTERPHFEESIAWNLLSMVASPQEIALILCDRCDTCYTIQQSVFTALKQLVTDDVCLIRLSELLEDPSLTVSMRYQYADARLCFFSCEQTQLESLLSCVGIPENLLFLSPQSDESTRVEQIIHRIRHIASEKKLIQGQPIALPKAALPPIESFSSWKLDTAPVQMSSFSEEKHHRSKVKHPSIQLDEPIDWRPERNILLVACMVCTFVWLCMWFCL